MTQEPTYQPTPEGLKALYEHHGEVVELIFDSILSGGSKVEEEEKQTTVK